MRVAVAGGRENADYLTGLLKKEGHRVILIQEDREYCEYLSARHDLPVVFGDPCREDVLSDAGLRGCGLLIALETNDADNLEICQMAKRLFEVKRTACLVENPGNVEIFESLGVDHVINTARIIAGFAGRERQ